MQKEMLDLELANPGIKLDPWCIEELRIVFRLLQREDLESWFGYAPNLQAKVRLGFDDIRVVLETIASRKPDSRMPVKRVPPKKIEANQLSDGIATLIKEGMTKASLVDGFFGKWHDPTFGERIAGAFREKYDSLRGTMTPDEIFYEIQAWIGGS